jgi:multicomponent Na+:H+ antiporter subunit E
LVNTLNLLPGTVSVSLDGDRLSLHVLDARMPIAEEVLQAEARIARMLEVSA